MCRDMRPFTASDLRWPMLDNNSVTGTRSAPVHCRDESYKLGWVAGFYGCSVNPLASSSAARSLFAAGYDDGLYEREQHSQQEALICMLSGSNGETAICTA